jgi:hypothetical protein
MRAKLAMEGLAALTALAALAYGGTPQPCAVVYGTVRDAFGYPYASGAEVRIQRAAVVCDHFHILGLLGSGCNYRLELNLDSGGGYYTTNAVHAGDPLTVAVAVAGTDAPLMPTHTLNAGKPGSLTRLDLCTGTDSDGDGLPDEWEQLLVEQSGGLLADIAAVRPTDDFDGDGMSNRDEFQAGTFPFLDTDLLAVQELKPVSAEGRFSVRFLAIANMTYRLVGRERLDGGTWYPVLFAGEPQAPATFRELVGDGQWRTVYVDMTTSSFFIRLAVH